MDDFVRNKLFEWDLSDLAETFKDHGIDEEQFLDLEDEDIKELIPKVGPRKKFKRQFKLLKEQQDTTNQETVASAREVFPSTSEASDTRNMHVDLQEQSSQCQLGAKRKRHNSAATEATNREQGIMCEVKNKMEDVKKKLQNQEKTKLNDFVRKQISELEERKREMVGVFGKTGAGKSSLINAIIGEADLLPSGSVSACTSVVFRVEAAASNKYEAEIEFVKKEDWRDELWSCKTFLENDDNAAAAAAAADDDDDDDDDNKEVREKLTAVYGDDWISKPVDELMENRYFRGINEFLTSHVKTLKCDSARQLRERLETYISTSNEGEDGGRLYWPLLKCVNIKVPDNNLLKQVVLVDLPGTGDRNKSRNKMWKKIVGNCSTVWIVADINRAEAEPEAWEILQNASSLMGNGGECRRIHFICTKSDNIEQSANVRNEVLKRNQRAKRLVMAELKKKLKDQFSEDCFEVFTVSRNEFLNRKHLRLDDTEIPKLQDFLQSLNHDSSETKNYVSAAHGILSLIQGSRSREVAREKQNISKYLQEKMAYEVHKLQKKLNEIKRTFEECLTDGVEESTGSSIGQLNNLLNPRRPAGRAFHRSLKFAVMNNGVFKAKKGKKQSSINITLSSKLTGSIDEEFRKTFPNKGKSGPLKAAIESFSLDTEGLIKSCPQVYLQLTFLKTEEDKVKIKLNQIIQEDKKSAYNSLIETIEDIMQGCYTDAANITGTGSLRIMRDIIEERARGNMDMFQKAKDNMLEQLYALMDTIVKMVMQTLRKSIELSLGTDDYSFPDVSEELDVVGRCYHELESSQTEH